MLYKRLRQDPFAGVGMDQGPYYPWYNSIYTNNPNTAGYVPDLQLCDYWEQQTNNLAGGGNLFQYAYLDIESLERGASLLSAGVLLTDATPGTDTVAALLTTTSGACYGITLTSGGLTPNAEVGNYLIMQDLGISRVILSNTASDVIFSLFDTLPSGPDANALIGGGPGLGTPISIYRPGHVVVNTAPSYPVGVLLNDILEGQPIVMQIRGLAAVLGTNSAAALAVGENEQAIASGLVSGTSGGAIPASQAGATIIAQEAYNSVTVARLMVQFKAAGL